MTIATNAASLANGQQTHILDVVIIGAGFSGICAGIKLKEQGIENYKIYDKAPKVGGTWYHNTYPGVACDVASHLYCFSFEPNANWSRVFSPGNEIRDYIEHCAIKYKVTPHINHGMEHISSVFNNETQLWDSRFADGTTVSSHHIISGSGGLHVPSYPDLKDKDLFKGPTIHSAEWDHNVNLKGKRIAVIGSAASAVQIIPELAEIADHLDVYQRTPNYIMPRNNRNYTDKEKSQFSSWPLINKIYRHFLFLKGDVLTFPLVKTKEPTKYSERATRLINGFMKTSVKNNSVHDALTPIYPPGCKRILLSDDFFATLNRDNVDLITGGATGLSENGVLDSEGNEHAADVIVYATGFDIDKHMFATEFIGPDGIDLREHWKKMPEAYEGAMVAGYPNLYFTTGPNTGVGTTSVVYMIEKQVNYIMQAIKKTGTKKLISVKRQVMDDFNEEIQGKLQQTVWAGNCKSYYKREDGKIATLYPYNARTFRNRHKRLKTKEFDIISKA
jgi:cation diffusion facilitator CzcD-associated flavoprotein CzcO